MNKFIDTKERGKISLPSIYMILNGKVLEHEIEGYRTLNIRGRETIGKKIESDEVPGRDGAVFLGATYEPREITVEYQLIAKTNEAFLAAFEQLNSLLGADQSSLVFSDEPDYTYTGTLSDMREPPAGLNAVTSSYKLWCASPFKVGRLIALNAGDRIATQLARPVVPERIVIVPSSTVNKITVTNGRETISLTGSFNAGENVTIRPRYQDIYQKGQYRMTLLDLTSDFENFQLRTGDTVTMEQAGTLTFQFREVKL